MNTKPTLEKMLQNILDKNNEMGTATNKMDKQQQQQPNIRKRKTKDSPTDRRSQW